MGAVPVRLRVAMVDDQISGVRNPGERIGKDDDVMLVVKQGIRQQEQRTRQAQPPKYRRHDDLVFLFGRVPLDEKREEKTALPDQPMTFQKTFQKVHSMPRQLSVVPKHIYQPVHSAHD